MLNDKKSERDTELQRSKPGKNAGDIHELIDVGDPATIDGLMKELDIKERLDGIIYKCLKQILAVRGVKSFSPVSSVSTPQFQARQKQGDHAH